MTASALDLSDFSLWRNGFPDELFTAAPTHHQGDPNLVTYMSIYDEMAISLRAR